MLPVGALYFYPAHVGRIVSLVIKTEVKNMETQKYCEVLQVSAIYRWLYTFILFPPTPERIDIDIASYHRDS